MRRDRGAYQRFVRATLLEAPPTADLVTVPNIEILEVGEDWETSTGIFTWDYGDIQSAIASQDDPAVRTPVMKLGHIDPRFDGQPVFGRIINLRTSENGQTLVCDLAGVPRWLAEVMPTAYPRRSIEGWFNHRTRTGHEWPFVLTALALLGDAYPAINTLEDLQVLWGAQVPELVPVEDHDTVVASGPLVRATRTEDRMPQWRQGGPPPPTTEEPPMPGTGVQAAVSVSDLTRTYYESLNDAQWWWWIREVRVDPAELIIDDDEGSLFRVAYAIEGDTIVFSDPVEVRIEYVEVAASAAGGRPGVRLKTAPLEGDSQRIMAAYGSPTEAGRPTRQSPTVRRAAASGTVPGDEEVEGMKLSDDALAKLGLGPDATDDEINAAIVAMSQGGGGGGDDDGGQGGGEEQAPEAPTPTTTEPSVPGSEPDSPSGTVDLPEGMVLIDQATLDELKGTAQTVGEMVAAARKRERDDFLKDAVRAGKFPRARLAHYEKLYDLDPEGTRQNIEALASGLVPVEERGNGAGDTDVPGGGSDAYPPGWRRTVEATRRGVGSTRVKMAGD